MGTVVVVIGVDGAVGAVVVVVVVVTSSSTYLSINLMSKILLVWRRHLTVILHNEWTLTVMYLSVYACLTYLDDVDGSCCCCNC